MILNKHPQLGNGKIWINCGKTKISIRLFDAIQRWDSYEEQDYDIPAAPIPVTTTSGAEHGIKL